MMSTAQASRPPGAWDRLCPLGPRGALLDRSVEVWLAAPEALAEDGHRLRDELSLAEHARMARFRFERDSELYLASHVFLRQVLSLYGPHAPAAWQFDTGVRGRPEIARAQQPQGARLRFSLSHTHGLVAVAVARGWDVGVDVERHRADLDVDGLAALALAAPERAWHARLGPAERATAFVTLWTVKEAVLKACGAGIGRDLTRVAVPDGLRAPGEVIARAPGLQHDRAAWTVAFADVHGGYALAVATGGPLRIGAAPLPARRLAIYDLRRRPTLAGDAMERAVVRPVRAPPPAVRPVPCGRPCPSFPTPRASEVPHDIRHP